MTDKSTQIIEAAIKLFAEKGFHSTSIQEIADAAGIAKGSMYLHFKSKDDLLLSIYKSYFERIFQDITKAGQHAESKRERMKIQVRVELEKLIEYRDFIKMQMREQFIHQNKDIKNVALQGRMRGSIWLHEQILDLYGEEIRPWATDCVTLYQSMIGSYMGLMVMFDMTFDMEKLAEFLIGRLDDMAYGLMKSRPEPILKEADFMAFASARFACGDDPLNQVKEQLKHLSELVDTLPAEDGDKKDLLDTLQVLEEELQKQEPKRVIIQGMMTVLQQAGKAELKKPLKQLQTAITHVLEKK
jgi:AcrR family transcriptional regulator